MLSQADNIHDDEAVKQTIKFAREAESRKRRAFAYGLQGSAQVMVVVNSTQCETARKKLRKMMLGEADPMSSRVKPGTAVRVQGYGLLHRDSDDQWIFECIEKPELAQLKDTKKYFLRYKKPSPFQNIILRRLKDDGTNEDDIDATSAIEPDSDNEIEGVPTDDADGLLIRDEFDADLQADASSRVEIVTPAYSNPTTSPAPAVLPVLRPSHDEILRDLLDTVALLIGKRLLATPGSLNERRLEKLLGQTMNSGDKEANPLLAMDRLLTDQRGNQSWLRGLVGLSVTKNTPLTSLQARWREAYDRIFISAAMFKSATDDFLQLQDLPPFSQGGGTWNRVDQFLNGMTGWKLTLGSGENSMADALKTLSEQLAFLDANALIIGDLDVHDYAYEKGTIDRFRSVVREIQTEIEMLVERQTQPHQHEGFSDEQ
jgi:hypothetical protein